MRMPVAAALAASLLVCGHAASACEGKTVLFEDEFKDTLGGWGSDPNIKIGDGRMTMLVNPADLTKTGSNSQFNDIFLLKDADVCVDAQMPRAMDAEPTVGLMFWGVDYSNYYLLQVQTNGDVTTWRRAGGRWSLLFTDKNTGAKTGPGAVNRLRVVIKGLLVSTFVNGSKVRDFRGQRPELEYWKFGCYMQYDKATPSPEARTAVFQNFKVTSVD